MNFTITDEKRPCWVNGEKALFHRFTHDTKLMSDGQFHEFLFAVVEFMDGSVNMVEPTDVIFADGGEMMDMCYIPLEKLENMRKYHGKDEA